MIKYELKEMCDIRQWDNNPATQIIKIYLVSVHLHEEKFHLDREEVLIIDGTNQNGWISLTICAVKKKRKQIEIIAVK